MTSLLMQFFDSTLLPPDLRAVVLPFSQLAERMEAELPNNAEKQTALRKLLESKDCAVRAWISRPKP